MPLATRHFMSFTVKLTYSSLTNSETREVNKILTPSSRRCMSTYILLGPTSWFHHVSLVPDFQHFTTSLPEALPPLYPNTQIAEIPNSSLPLIATRDFGTFGTEVSTSYPPICQNVKILTRRERGSHNRTSCLFEFRTSRLHES
jgi:hypothetical protein